MKQLFTKINCAYCGEETLKTVWNKTTCGRECSVNLYNKSEKGRKSSKRTYERQKARGTAYYMSKKGKENNIKRSRKYRLLNSEKVKKYKYLKSKEYMAKNKQIYGTVMSPERMKQARKNLRVWQRLRRISIKGSLASRSELNIKDIKVLERDIKDLKDIKEKLLNHYLLKL